MTESRRTLAPGDPLATHRIEDEQQTCPFAGIGSCDAGGSGELDLYRPWLHMGKGAYLRFGVDTRAGSQASISSSVHRSMSPRPLSRAIRTRVEPVQP